MKLKLKIEGGGRGLSDLLAFRAYSLLVAFAASSQFFFLLCEKTRRREGAPREERALYSPACYFSSLLGTPQ